MAVRPKRKAPISTRPIYLPKVRAKELLETASAGATAEEGPYLRILVDGASASQLGSTFRARSCLSLPRGRSWLCEGGKSQSAHFVHRR